MKMHAPKCQKRDLPDLKKRLIAYGIYDEYVAWQRNYISWRKGQTSGAKGEATSSRLEHSAWRDGYRRWRQGAITGAKGEAGDTTSAQKAISNEAAMFYDVVANEHGQPLLVPINGPAVTPMPIELFPPDALVTVRVFRFFENRNDASEPWERGLLNLNSGSLLWLPVHLVPGMHSVAGAKYGRCFTVHYLQVYAKHFKSAYHMCNEGYNPAKSFGSAAAAKDTIKGQPLKEGYFWFVSPALADGNASEQEHLKAWGWKHLARAGPFDGNKFAEQWIQHGSPMGVHDLQVVLEQFQLDSEWSTDRSLN